MFVPYSHAMLGTFRLQNSWNLFCHDQTFIAASWYTKNLGFTHPKKTALLIFLQTSQKTSKRNKTWPWSIQYFPSFSVLVNLISSWKTQNFTLSKTLSCLHFSKLFQKNLKGHDLVSIATSFKHLYKCISAAILQPGGLLSDCSFQISSMTVHGLSIFQHPWTKPTPPFTSWTLAEQLFWLIVTKQQLHHDCPTN